MVPGFDLFSSAQEEFFVAHTIFRHQLELTPDGFHVAIEYVFASRRNWKGPVALVSYLLKESMAALPARLVFSDAKSRKAFAQFLE